VRNSLVVRAAATVAALADKPKKESQTPGSPFLFAGVGKARRAAAGASDAAKAVCFKPFLFAPLRSAL
jgi:hypothetical protein